MVLLTLALMLVLSAAISVNAVPPVLNLFAVFLALYAVGVLACVLPMYARSRVASSTRLREARRAPSDLVVSRASWR
jgi:hypothetical protein